MTRFLLSSSALKQVDAVGVGCFLFERFEDGLHVLVKVGHEQRLQVSICGCTPRLERYSSVHVPLLDLIGLERDSLSNSFVNPSTASRTAQPQSWRSCSHSSSVFLPLEPT